MAERTQESQRRSEQRARRSRSRPRRRRSGRRSSTEEGRERWLEEPDREVARRGRASAPQPARLVVVAASDEPATRVEFRVVAVPAGARVVVTESAAARFPLARARDALRAGARLSDELGAVFAALADPTRRRDGRGAAARRHDDACRALTAELPITRQAVAKHLATLDDAGLVERAPARGREVRYRLRDGALVLRGRVARRDRGRLGRPSGAPEGRRRAQALKLGYDLAVQRPVVKGSRCESDADPPL